MSQGCPLCGSSSSILTKTHYTKLLRENIKPELVEESKRTLLRLEKKIKKANGGNLTPTEEKLMNIIRCQRLGVRKAPKKRSK